MTGFRVVSTVFDLPFAETDAEELARSMRRFKANWYDLIEKTGLRPTYGFWADFLDVIDALEAIGGEKRG